MRRGSRQKLDFPAAVGSRLERSVKATMQRSEKMADHHGTPHHPKRKSTAASTAADRSWWASSTFSKKVHDRPAVITLCAERMAVNHWNAGLLPKVSQPHRPPPPAPARSPPAPLHGLIRSCVVMPTRRAALGAGKVFHQHQAGRCGVFCPAGPSVRPARKLLGSFLATRASHSPASRARRISAAPSHAPALCAPARTTGTRPASVRCAALMSLYPPRASGRTPRR